MKETKKTKKTTKQKEAPREHKKSWQELTASITEIEEFLSNNVFLRKNLVTRRTEVHVLTEFADEIDKGPYWQPLSDRILNTLWANLALTKPNTRIEHILRVIESDYTPEFHPFQAYLDSLPKWDGKEDHIRLLAMTVDVGSTDEQLLFEFCLKKFLVGMVGAWISPKVINNVVLILLGHQGCGKTTWMSHLLPPQLRDYFYVKTDAARMTKDDLLTLAKYGLICIEELDTMSSKEHNMWKAAITMPSISQREAYAHYHDNYEHIASFCGTGNNIDFLVDRSGSRRFLPFVAKHIESPLLYPFDYQGIYSQAYALYRDGFQFWFSQQEIQRMSEHNRRFETPRLEQELIMQYFRKPLPAEPGEWVSVAAAMQTVASSLTQKISSTLLGRAFVDLGFERRTVHNMRGYIVVRRSAEEMQAMRRQMAQEGDTDTANTDVF